MISNKLTLVALGVACVTAAGGGAYLATRAASPAASQAAAVVPTPPTPAVQETEAVVGDAPRQAAPTTRPVAVEPVEAPAASTSTAPRRRAQAASTTAPRASTQAAGSVGTVQTPALERSWPSSTSGPAVLAPPEPPAPVELPRAPEPPARVFEEVVVSADSVIGLQLDSTISSEQARVEDRVEARVVRDVRAAGELAIPAGARALGSVTFVERGGKFKERARLGIRFHTLVLADGTRLPVSTEAITRFGDAPSNSSAAKIGGGAVAGAILGAIVGGAKGAAIGASSGAGAGTAVVMAGDRSAATFAAGAEVTARILSPVTVTIEK
jgi:hypothetical protein